MNLVALLLTVMFFSCPKLLAALAVILGVILLFMYYPLGITLFILIFLGVVFYKTFVG